MTAQARLSQTNSDSFKTSVRSLGPRLKVLRAHLAAWVATCADYYDAAALYDELSVLSDAELRRRGLSRATLASEVCESCDGSSALNCCPC
jgi:hypothetical protein